MRAIPYRVALPQSAAEACTLVHWCGRMLPKGEIMRVAILGGDTVFLYPTETDPGKCDIYTMEVRECTEVAKMLAGTPWWQSMKIYSTGAGEHWLLFMIDDIKGGDDAERP